MNRKLGNFTFRGICRGAWEPSLYPAATPPFPSLTNTCTQPRIDPPEPRSLPSAAIYFLSPFPLPSFLYPPSFLSLSHLSLFLPFLISTFPSSFLSLSPPFPPPSFPYLHLSLFLPFSISTFPSSFLIPIPSSSFSYSSFLFLSLLTFFIPPPFFPSFHIPSFPSSFLSHLSLLPFPISPSSFNTYPNFLSCPNSSSFYILPSFSPLSSLFLPPSPIQLVPIPPISHLSSSLSNFLYLNSKFHMGFQTLITSFILFLFIFL